MEGAERWHWVHCARHGTAGEVGGPCAATRKRERENTRERAQEKRESDESDNAVEGSEEYFEENVAEEEDSTNGEDGSDEEVRERAGGAREKEAG